jgi:hypothetical protein
LLYQIILLASPRHHQYHPPPLVKAEDFEEELGIEIMKLRQCQSRRQLNWKFESFFGAWPFYRAILWNALRRSRLLEKAPTAPRVNPRHLLMGLHFLKVYNTEERSAVTFGCDEKKTFNNGHGSLQSLRPSL